MKANGAQDLKMKSAQTQGMRRSSLLGARPRMLTLDISVIFLGLLALVAGQEVSDCSWKPKSDLEDGVKALECQMKTLQSGPTDLPQVMP